VGKVHVRVEGMELSVPQRSGGTTNSVAGIPTNAVQRLPDPDVRPRRLRRRFTADYKRRILQEADTCDPGEIAALLRRELGRRTRERLLRIRGESSPCSVAWPSLGQRGSPHLLSFGVPSLVGEPLARPAGSL